MLRFRDLGASCFGLRFRVLRFGTLFIKLRNSINVVSVVGILNLGLHANLKYDLEFFDEVMLFSENNKEMQHFNQ